MGEIVKGNILSWEGQGSALTSSVCVCGGDVPHTEKQLSDVKQVSCIQLSSNTICPVVVA